MKTKMNETIYKINLILLSFLVMFFVIAAIMPSEVSAEESECNPFYGGGEICNKSFDVEKEVRIKGDNKYKKEIDDVKEDDIIEFRIKVENIGDITVDNMRMEDFLPDALEKVSGGLTEYWDDFGPGDVEEFKIRAKIDPDEFDRDDTFEKCVVNIVEVEYDGHEEASDSATVCFKSEGEVLGIEELPETGAISTLPLSGLGIGLITVGTLLKRSSRKYY